MYTYDSVVANLACVLCVYEQTIHMFIFDEIYTDTCFCVCICIHFVVTRSARVLWLYTRTIHIFMFHRCIQTVYNYVYTCIIFFLFVCARMDFVVTRVARVLCIFIIYLFKYTHIIHICMFDAHVHVWWMCLKNVCMYVVLMYTYMKTHMYMHMNFFMIRTYTHQKFVCVQ